MSVGYQQHLQTRLKHVIILCIGSMSNFMLMAFYFGENGLFFIGLWCLIGTKITQRIVIVYR
jgi:hypothetical protein